MPPLQHEAVLLDGKWEETRLDVLKITLNLASKSD